MGNWTGFTDRLRRHGRSVDSTTRGYLNVAADRIEDLEAKSQECERRLNDILKRLATQTGDPYSGEWYDLCENILRENGK